MSLRNKAVLPRGKFKCDKLCSWCPSSLQLCFHPWDWGEMEALCCVETAQSLLMDSALQGDHLAPHFTVWQQKKDTGKGWVPPTPAEIAALHSCTEGTRFRRALTPQQTWERTVSTPHTSCVAQSLFVVTLALWSSNLDDKEGMWDPCTQRSSENVAQSLKVYSQEDWMSQGHPCWHTTSPPV